MIPPQPQRALGKRGIRNALEQPARPLGGGAGQEAITRIGEFVRKHAV